MSDFKRANLLTNIETTTSNNSDGSQMDKVQKLQSELAEERAFSVKQSKANANQYETIQKLRGELARANEALKEIMEMYHISEMKLHEIISKYFSGKEKEGTNGFSSL